MNQKNTIMLLLVFISGFSALCYEIIWIRTLSLIVGRTILSITVVTSIFMAGMGFGSLYWGSHVDKHNTPLRTVSILQFLICASGLITQSVFYALPSVYSHLYQFLGSDSPGSLSITVLLAVCIFAIPSFLLGGTFPCIVKAYTDTPDRIGKNSGILYAINTGGGICGVAGTGFFLLGGLGLTVTHTLAISLNGLAGCFAYFLARKTIYPTREGDAACLLPQTSEHPCYNTAKGRLILVMAALMGFCGLALEISITRVLSVFLINSSYVFTCILIQFLLGISIGSFLYARYMHASKHSLLIISLCQLIAGIYLTTISSHFNDLPPLITPLKQKFIEIPFFYFTLPGLTLSALILCIPTICMGILFPLFCNVYTRHSATTGTDIGHVSFANTSGSVIGPLAAAFCFIPSIGVVKSTMAIALLYLTSGVVAFWLSQQKKQFTKTAFLAIGVGILATPSLTSLFNTARIVPPSFFRTKGRNDSIIYYKETREGNVVINQDNTTKARYLYVNNTAVIGSTYDAVKAVKMLAILPFLVEPAEQKKVFIIGFGMGITAKEFSRQNTQAIECAEICPGIQESAAYFTHFNNDILQNPKVSFIGLDGRNYLSLTKKTYDVISCDPSHPNLGSGNLYSKEFFTLAKNHLSDKGVLSNYVPLHMITQKEFQSIVKTFVTVFPHATLWLGQSHCILLGTRRPQHIDFTVLKQLLLLYNDEIISDPYNLASSLLLDSTAMKKYSFKAEINRDDKPLLDYHSFHALHDENWHMNLTSILAYQIDPRISISHIPNNELFSRYVLGQQLFFEALMRKNQKYQTADDCKEVITLLQKAFIANPENKEIHSHLEHEMEILQSSYSR